MTNIEINELISVLEKIRAKQQPKIPASLIQDKEIQRKMLNIATAQGKKSAEKWLYMLAIASLYGCNKQC